MNLYKKRNYITTNIKNLTYYNIRANTKQYIYNPPPIILIYSTILKE